MTRQRTWLASLALAAIAPVTAVLVLGTTGSIEGAASQALGDPGAFTRYGLPVMRALRDIANSIALGALVLAAGAMGTTRGAVRLRTCFVTLAAAVGIVWVWADLATLVLTYSDFAGVPLTDSDAWGGLSLFLVQIDLARALIFNLVIAGVVAVACLFLHSDAAAFLLATLAASAWWPLASTGHAASDANHDLTVYVQVAHVIGASLWVGGLAALWLARKQLLELGLQPTVDRYSKVALAAVVLLTISGIANAALRLESWVNLTSVYGALLVAKSALLIALVGAGVWQRRRILPALGGAGIGARPFFRLATTELTLMAFVMGLAVALSRTPVP